MKATPVLVAAALAAALAVSPASRVLAQDGGKAQQMSPEEQEMMQKWMAFATPGAPHQALADHDAGKWTLAVKSWAVPGQPPETSAGTSEGEMILGGRYLLEHVNGTMMGRPFHGVNLVGYDNQNKEYRSVWVDDMGTGLMVSHGTMADDGKSVVMTGTTPDPMTGKDASFREVESWPDANTRLFEMYGTGPDGKEFKSMEITYTRQK